MNTSGEAADQVLRMSLEGTEFALKISGKAADKIYHKLLKLYKELKNETKKTKGKMRLKNLLSSGKPVDIYTVEDKNLKKFCTEANKYGLLYTVLKDRNDGSNTTDVMVKRDDKARIDRIWKRLGLANTELESIKAEVVKQVEDEKQEPVRADKQKSKEEEFLDELMAKPNPTKEEGQSRNPDKARATKSSQSVPSSETKRNRTDRPRTTDTDSRTYKPSVRKELDNIRKEQELQLQKSKSKKKSKSKTQEHIAPKKTKKDKER